MKSSVLILPISHYAYAIKRFKECDAPVNWIYLGKDFSTMHSFESIMPEHFKRMQIGRLHDVIADRIRKDFVYWLDRLNDLLGTDKEWWFESVSGRNIYESDLFQNCCYVEVIKELFGSDNPELPAIVFTDSKALAGILTTWLAYRGIGTVFYKHFYIRISFKKMLLAAYNYCFFIRQLLLRVANALLTRPQEKRSKSNIKTPYVLIDAIFHDNLFHSDGSFHDPYYSGLYEFFHSKGYDIKVYPILSMFYPKLSLVYTQMRKSHYDFIIPEDYLRLPDFINIVSYPLRLLKRNINTAPFLGTDVTQLIKEERMSPNFLSSMFAVLIYRFFIRFKNHYPAPKIIVDRYENQIIDRAFIFGAREAFPGVKIIGAQLFLHLPNFINFFPTKAEIKYGLVPDLVLCTSQLQCEMARSFSSEFRCLPCAALRYSHLFDSSLGIGTSADKKNILVLLPYGHDDAVEFLNMLKEALKMFSRDVPVMIRCHPFLDTKSLGSKLEGWPGKICDKAFKEELSRALVVVGYESSSLVEALALGIPAIFTTKQNGFSLNPLVEIPNEIARVCHSSSELVEALKYFCFLPLSERSRFKSEALRIRDLYFTPVTEETLEPFLGMYR